MSRLLFPAGPFPCFSHPKLYLPTRHSYLALQLVTQTNHVQKLNSPPFPHKHSCPLCFLFQFMKPHLLNFSSQKLRNHPFPFYPRSNLPPNPMDCIFFLNSSTSPHPHCHLYEKHKCISKTFPCFYLKHFT